MVGKLRARIVCRTSRGRVRNAVGSFFATFECKATDANPMRWRSFGLVVVMLDFESDLVRICTGMIG